MPVDETRLFKTEAAGLVLEFKVASLEMDSDSVGAALVWLVADYITCFAVEHQSKMRALFERCVQEEMEVFNAIADEGWEVE